MYLDIWMFAWANVQYITLRCHVCRMLVIYYRVTYHTEIPRVQNACDILQGDVSHGDATCAECLWYITGWRITLGSHVCRMLVIYYRVTYHTEMPRVQNACDILQGDVSHGDATCAECLWYITGWRITLGSHVCRMLVIYYRVTYHAEMPRVQNACDILQGDVSRWDPTCAECLWYITGWRITLGSHVCRMLVIYYRVTYHTEMPRVQNACDILQGDVSHGDATCAECLWYITGWRITLGSHVCRMLVIYYRVTYHAGIPRVQNACDILQGDVSHGDPTCAECLWYITGWRITRRSHVCRMLVIYNRVTYHTEIPRVQNACDILQGDVSHGDHTCAECLWYITGWRITLRCHVCRMLVIYYRVTYHTEITRVQNACDILQGDVSRWDATCAECLWYITGWRITLGSHVCRMLVIYYMVTYHTEIPRVQNACDILQGDVSHWDPTCAECLWYITGWRITRRCHVCRMFVIYYRVTYHTEMPRVQNVCDILHGDVSHWDPTCAECLWYITGWRITLRSHVCRMLVIYYRVTYHTEIPRVQNACDILHGDVSLPVTEQRERNHSLSISGHQ